MAEYNKKNLANSTLASPIDDDDTSVVVQTGEGANFPSTPFYATLTPYGVISNPANSEIVQVTARTSDTLTITRAQRSTTAKSFLAGAVIANGIYTQDFDDLNQDDIGDGTTYKQYSATDKTKLAGIETAADVTDAGNVGSSIHGASAKTTPVDADTIAIIDSAASNVLKKLSFSNLWAWILAKTSLSGAGWLASSVSSTTDKAITPAGVKSTTDTLLVNTGWIDATSDTWTYASATTITVTSGSAYKAGQRVKFTQSSTVKYGVIKSISSNTLTIWMLNAATIANSAITAMAYSREETPEGTESIMVTSYTNSGNGTGTFYYVIHVNGTVDLWGQTAATVGKAAPDTWDVNLPSGLFANVRMAMSNPGPNNTTNNMYTLWGGGGITTTKLQINFYASTTTSAMPVNVWCKGNI